MKSKSLLFAMLAFSLFTTGCPTVDRAYNHCAFLAYGNETGDLSPFDASNCNMGVRILVRNAGRLGYTKEAVEQSFDDCDNAPSLTTEQAHDECRIGVASLRDLALTAAASEEHEGLEPRPGQRR